MHEASRGPQDEVESRGASSSARRWSISLGLFAFALLVRALPIHDVIVNKHVLFTGYDAYYHMRRVLYSLVNFPAYVDFDRYLNFPTGARAIWSPFFDWMTAAIFLPVRARLTVPDIEHFAIWIPPVLGALTVATLYRASRRFYGESTAVVAGGFLSILSAHFWYSQLGFLDHHCAVSLATTLLLFSAMGFADRLERGVASRSVRGVRSAVGLGAGLGVTLLLWPGALFHVGLVEIALLVFLLGRRERPAAAEVGKGLAIAHATAGLLVVPFALGSEWPQWSAFSPVVLSNFQPWFFGAATAFSVVCGWGWRFDELGGSRGRRVATGLVTIASLVGSSLAIWPELAHGALEVWTWFAKADDFQSLVAESAPLFRVRDAYTLDVAVSRFSGVVLFAPLLFVAAIVLLRARGIGAPTWLFLWWTLGLSIATIFQKRFMNSSSVAFSLLVAIVLVLGSARLCEWLASERRGRIVVRAAIALIVTGLLWPMLATYGRYAGNLYLRTQGQPTQATSLLMHKLAIVKTARWMRENTPETAGWLDSNLEPQYGVMAPWGLGHVIEYEGRRATINDNFGDDIGSENFLLAREYFLGGEELGVQILERLKARYVVAQRSPQYLGQAVGPGALYHSLYMRDGSARIGDGGDDALPQPALRRHRLIYESRPASFATMPDAGFKVFEFVRGALIVGRASAGAQIDLLLRLETNQGRKVDYRARVSANAQGHYRFRVPYPTGVERGEGEEKVRTGDYYFISCGDESRAMRIPEAAIRDGSSARGPDLCLPARPPAEGLE